ncbi:MJ0042-type zinc finger domain-containing protein [Blastopirellula retiformator]|uniref:Double zinc ribbon n=1 Tax=Blastopirellula retiformator TaxID=2527970 RepID=A0A5C5V0P6_9BACT|nr:MJ0042-type zinc finger domain-containing protein [Blastopirellula retiformator]TWT31961.1 hypothetical protein Enr8_38870 [Blastopirellula retiformator]
MEILKFACTSCSAQLQAAASAAGDSFTCPHCEHSLRVPQPDAVGVIRSGGRDNEETEAVVCPLCNTRVTIQSADLGKKVKCPDCETAFVAKAPAKKLPPKPQTTDDDDFYSLKEETHDDSASKQMAARYFEEAERQAKVERERHTYADKPYQKAVEQTAATAYEAEPYAEKKRESLTPEDYDPRATRVKNPVSLAPDAIKTDFKFFCEVQFLTRWIVAALGMAVVLYTGINAMLVRINVTDGIGGFGAYLTSFVLSALTVVIGAIVLVYLASAFMNISTSIASGVAHLVWPETPAFERIMETVFFVIALMMALLPSGLVSALISPYLGVPLGGLSFVLFPYFYLSLLDSGTPLVPLSSSILAAVGRKLHKWILFYMVTGAVLAVVLVAMGIGYFFCGEEYQYVKYMVLPAGVLTTGYALFYAVWLGKLGWECSQDVGETPENAADG